MDCIENGDLNGFTQRSNTVSPRLRFQLASCMTQAQWIVSFLPNTTYTSAAFRLKINPSRIPSYLKAISSVHIDFFSSHPYQLKQQHKPYHIMASQTTPAASTAPSKFSGSCLCGNVKYTITGTPSLNVVCHCINCKKASGSAFMANGMYKEEVSHAS